MRKLYFLLAVFVSLHLHAQVSIPISIDFTTENMWRSLVSNFPGQPSSTGDFVSVPGFTYQGLEFEFGRAAIRYTVDERRYNLSLLLGADMTIRAPKGCLLTSVKFTSALVSDLNLAIGSSGTYNHDTQEWVSTSPTDTVKFKNYVNTSYIWNMTVTYSEESVILEPTVYPSEADRPTTLNEIKLVFPYAHGNLILQSGVGAATLKGDYVEDFRGSVNQVLSPTFEDNAVTLHLAEPLEHDGEFTLEVPARLFRDQRGYENVAVQSKIVVRENRATFVPVSINPENHGKLTSLSSPIVLTFPTNVGNVNTQKRFRMFLNGVDEPIAQLKAVKGESDTEVILEFVNSAKSVFTDYGTYSVKIDEGTVANHNFGDELYERYNPDIQIEYTIEEPVDPLDVVKAKATELLSYAGCLGYPTVDAEETVKLMNLLSNETSTEQQFSDAIMDFYICKQIVMPETGKWYQIKSVNSKGHSLFLHYADKTVTLSDSPSPYKVLLTTDRNKLVLQTEDGNYLHVMIGDDLYDYTSSANVTDERTYVTYLTLEKMMIDGADDQSSVLGMFCIKGPIGNDKNNGTPVGDVYALVDHNNRCFITSVNEPNRLFEEVRSSAFILISTENIVNPTASLKESKLANNTQKLTLIIGGSEEENDISHVMLNASAKPYFVPIKSDGTDGDAVTLNASQKIIEKINDGTHDNYFLIHVDGLADGNYKMIMPTGTFDYHLNEKPVVDKELTVEFSIQDPTSYEESLMDSLVMIWGTIPALAPGEVIGVDELRNIKLYMSLPIYPSSNTARNIATLYHRMTNKFIAQGHFVSDEVDARPSLRLVYNETTPLPVSLPSGDYIITIPKAAFGDLNFYLYQNGDQSISPQECKINRSIYLSTTIGDNTDIISVLDTEKNRNEVFDLQGRRVQQMDKKGVYIVNGRKVVKR